MHASIPLGLFFSCQILFSIEFNYEYSNIVLLALLHQPIENNYLYALPGTCKRKKKMTRTKGR